MSMRFLTVLGLSLLGGCSSPHHLQYDFGRAYTTATAAQADRTRPSAANADHPLQGVEAAAIRQNVTESTTDTETGQTTLSSKN